MSNARKVRDFHEAIGSYFPQVPQVPSAEVLTLRRTLIGEEVREVEAEFEALMPKLSHAGGPANAQVSSAQASSAQVSDLTALTHELVDLLYVTYGALEALGVDADAVFAEVHRVNMHKATGPKRADGKQLKPEGWQPADVAGVIARLAAKEG